MNKNTVHVKTFRLMDIHWNRTVRATNLLTHLLTITSTHWGRDKVVVILITTISHAFHWMKIYNLLRFYWTTFPRVHQSKICNRLRKSLGWTSEAWVVQSQAPGPGFVAYNPGPRGRIHYLGIQNSNSKYFILQVRLFHSLVHKLMWLFNRLCLGAIS